MNSLVPDISGRLTAVFAMNPQVAEAVLTQEIRARLAAVADFDGSLVVTDLFAPGAAAAVAGADILITGWDAPVLDAAALARAPRLRAVFHAAGSVKPFARQAVWDRGVVVSSAAEANAYPVAQYTVSMILLAGKRAFRYAADYRNGIWRSSHVEPRDGNRHRVVGVIGASRIGRLVLPLLAAEGYRLLVSDPTLTRADARRLLPGADLRLVDVDTLCREADIVSIHAPALPETHHLVDDRRLSLMRDGTILVNTARGSLVDTEALVRHCGAGRIDAVLDVTVPEPLPPGHPLLAMPNVMVTPHIAGALGTEVSRFGDFAVAEVERFVAGKPLLGAVTADDLLWIA